MSAPERGRDETRLQRHPVGVDPVTVSLIISGTVAVMVLLNLLWRHSVRRYERKQRGEAQLMRDSNGRRIKQRRSKRGRAPQPMRHEPGPRDW